MNKKICTDCKFLLVYTQYSKNPKNKDGYLHQCKSCVYKKTKIRLSKNKELIKKQRREIYHRNRDKNIQDAIRWGRINKEKRDIAKKKWRDKNKELTNHLTKNYIYRKKHAKGSHTLEEYNEKVERFGGLCVYCNKNKGDTKDHIIPLSKGGTNFIDNIVPACRSCNSSKRDKTLLEWIKNK